MLLVLVLSAMCCSESIRDPSHASRVIEQASSKVSVTSKASRISCPVAPSVSAGRRSPDDALAPRCAASLRVCVPANGRRQAEVIEHAELDHIQRLHGI